MWLLVTFITLWAISPGPVCILTIQESRKQGARAGVAISAGAAVTATLMVVAALLIHLSGLTSVLDPSNMSIIEIIGAVGIILMGLYAGYKCLLAREQKSEASDVNTKNRASFFQGMAMMVTSIPHALLFYNVIMPQTVELADMTSTILALGSLKVLLIFGFHAIVALVAGYAQNWFSNNRFRTTLDFSLATLLVVMGVNILL